MSNKKKLTDVELVCNIINVFYLHRPLTCLTAKQMHNYLHSHFIVEQTNISKIMQTMVSQSLIGMKSVEMDNKGKVLEWGYVWSIRQQDDGSHPIHISNG